MKRITIATVAVLLFSANVMAATEISADQAEQRQSIRTVSLTQNFVSPDDAVSTVNQIADKHGATAYRIIALHEPGSTNSTHVTAVLYR
jgi:uncharacterized protein YdeI (BOF family)